MGRKTSIHHDLPAKDLQNHTKRRLEESIEDAFEARLAILGASAFGCGVLRAYGIAITCFEALSLQHMVVPLTLSSLTAVFVAHQVSEPFFDLSLRRRGWQGISDMTCSRHAEAPAFQVMQSYPHFSCLGEQVMLSDVHLALNSGDFSFPVLGRDVAWHLLGL